MPEYRVRWEIELDAESVQDAAEKALATQRDPESHAVVFDVQQLGHGTRSQWQQVDLLGDDDEEDPVREGTDALKHERRHGDPQFVGRDGGNRCQSPRQRSAEGDPSQAECQAGRMRALTEP